jgi:uncharacterized membrane protein
MFAITLLMLNMLLLLGVTIVPFPTAFIAEYLGHDGEQLAALVHAGNGTFIAASFWGLWRDAASPARRPPLLRTAPESPDVRAINAKYWVGPVFFLAAVALVFLSAKG